MTERYTWGGDQRDRMDFTIPDPPGLPTTIPNLSDFVVTITADTSAFEAAIRRVATLAHRLRTAWVDPAAERRHRRRCPECNPRGYPEPLRVNGADYHHRRNNRRKRA